MNKWVKFGLALIGLFIASVVVIAVVAFYALFLQ